MTYLANIRPTRSELLTLKNRLRVASKAHFVLQMKYTGIIREITRLAPEVKKEYDLLLTRHSRVQQLIADAYMIEGSVAIRIAAFSVEMKTEIDLHTRNVSGVVVPVITGKNVKTDLLERGYGILGTSPIIDELADAYEDLTLAIIAYAGNVASLKHLIQESERIGRRVKALENIVIPQVKTAIIVITRERDELEREEASRLFHIKKMRTQYTENGQPLTGRP
jgi:V/A-type H+-transporting ATPase subunit D